MNTRHAQRIGYSPPMIDYVDDHLQHSRDNLDTTRAACGKPWFAVVEHDNWCHGTQRPLSAPTAFASPPSRPKTFGTPGLDTKSSISLFSRKPAPATEIAEPYDVFRCRYSRPNCRPHPSPKMRGILALIGTGLARLRRRKTAWPCPSYLARPARAAYSSLVSQSTGTS